MLENFTDAGRRVEHLAYEEALDRNDDHIGTEHLLLALLTEVTTEGEAAVTQALQGLGISPEQLRLQIGAAADLLYGPRETPHLAGADIGLPYTPDLKKVLDLAPVEARRLGYRHVGPAQLLLALLAHNEGLAADVLAENGATFSQFRDQLVEPRTEANLGTILERLDRIEQTLTRIAQTLDAIERRSGGA